VVDVPQCILQPHVNIVLTIAAHAQVANARQICTGDEGAVRDIDRRDIQLVPRTDNTRKLNRVHPTHAE
jgi:hypothetical protein